MKKRYILVPALLVAGVAFFMQRPSKAKWYEKALEDVTRAIEEVEGAGKKALQSVANVVIGPFKKKIKKEQYPISKNPYKETIAVIRRGGPISEGEQTYVAMRRQSAHKALKRFVGFDTGMDAGLSLSGGGNRAAVYMWGALDALDQIGLLDAMTWMTTLSGSGWMIWPWLASGSNLQDHKARLLASVTHGPALRNKKHVKGVIDVILRDLAYGRLVNLATLYGAGLGSIFFDGFGEYRDPQMVWMDKIQNNMNASPALFPYPIMTTLSVPDGRWFTVTPHEFGSAALKAFIPEWAGQREFFGGGSVGKKPYADRVAVARWMGDSALAPGASFGELYLNIFAAMPEEKKGQRVAKQLLEAFFAQSPMERLRAVYSERYNFLYGVPGLPMYNKVKKQTWGDVKTVKFTDVGVISGNPILPLLERAAISTTPVIIVIIDASSVVGYDELAVLRDYAVGGNPDGIVLPFPELPSDRKQLSTQTVTAFSNDKVLMIYMPMVKNEQLIAAYKDNPAFKDIVSKLGWDLKKRLGGSYNTFNLKYTYEKAEELIALAQFNVLVSADKIRAAIREYGLKYMEKTNPNHAQQIRQLFAGAAAG